MKRSEVFWRPLLCGVFIGGLGVAPGVSGGALAASFGYYALLLFAAAHPIKAVKTAWKTLFPLGMGLALGVVAFGRVLLRGFEAFPAEMRCAVAGLMLGTLLLSGNEVFAPPHRLRQGVLALTAFAAGLWLFYGNLFPTVSAIPRGSDWVLCGGVYAFGTVVPGVSASCILLSMDGYDDVLGLLAGEHLSALVPFALGFAAVAVCLVVFVNALYTRYQAVASALVFGFTVSSVVSVSPPLALDKASIVAVLCGLFAFALVCAGRKSGEFRERWLTDCGEI